ncbi:putative transmembrane protein [Pasteurella multocida]|nr:putative transmembrane protein [Pasteurella multocida]
MQNWTTEMWQAAGIGLVIGLILGYLFLRLTKGSVKKTTSNGN